MKDIEIIEYYIFVNDNKTKLCRFKTLEELLKVTKSYIDNLDTNEYIGIGGDFWVINPGDNKEFGSLDFINKHANEEKFAFCRDIKTLDIKLPSEVKTALEGLIAEL